MEEKIIFLNEDQKAVLTKALKDIRFASGQLEEWATKGTLSEEMSKMLPSLIESYFSEAASVLNYQSHLLEEKEKRYIDIRKANQKIRELEEKLGSERGTDGLKEQLKHLYEKVSDWWGMEGFNHTSNEKFTAYGALSVEFCFMLEFSRRYSNTPASDERGQKEHVQFLRDRGFEFADFEKSRSEKLDLIDNQTNRTLLTKMLKERFPSIEIRKWDNRCSYSKPDIFVIKHIDATIYDLSDI